jgi:hypothetical protein
VTPAATPAAAAAGAAGAAGAPSAVPAPSVPLEAAALARVPLPLPPLKVPLEQPSLLGAYATPGEADGPTAGAHDGSACLMVNETLSPASTPPALGKTSSPTAQDRPTKKLVIRLKRSPGSPTTISNALRPAHVPPPLATPLTPTPPEAVPASSRPAVERAAAGTGMPADTRAAAPSAQPSSPAAALTSQLTESPERALEAGITAQTQLGVDDILRRLHALDTSWTQPGGCRVQHIQLSLDAPPVVSDGGGGLPPAGEECQLPDDFISAYGIRSTQVLSFNEPLSS